MKAIILYNLMSFARWMQLCYYYTIKTESLSITVKSPLVHFTPTKMAVYKRGIISVGEDVD